MDGSKDNGRRKKMKINRTRERILDKSIELFNRKQASNVSTVQISTALEISPGNLYYYYTNKEEVIRCTWKERMVPEITEILETAEEINDKKDLEQYLKKFLAHYAKFRFFYTERTTMFYNDWKICMSKQLRRKRKLWKLYLTGGQAKAKLISAKRMQSFWQTAA